MSEQCVKSCTATAAQIETSPERLIREAISLGLILGVVLIISRLLAFFPWGGCLSSFLFLLLAAWHKWRFNARVRILSVGTPSFVLSISFAALLCGALIVSACYPIAAERNAPVTAWAMVNLLLLVPLAEEFYFRGLLLEHLVHGVGKLPAVVGTTALFALLHWQVAGGAVVVAGILSLVACLLVLRTGCLAQAIQLHIAWNAFTVIHQTDSLSARWLMAATISTAVLMIAFVNLRSGVKARTHVTTP